MSGSARAIQRCGPITPGICGRPDINVALSKPVVFGGDCFTACLAEWEAIAVAQAVGSEGSPGLAPSGCSLGEPGVVTNGPLTAASGAAASPLCTMNMNGAAA